MANEWRRHEVADLIAGDQLLVGDGYRAKNDELGMTGLPFARAGNIDGGFQFAGADRFPTARLDRLGNKVSKPGDVVFTSKGTVGRFAFVRQDTPQFVYSPQLCFWRSLNQELISSHFLYYWMHGREFYVQFKGVAGQTDMADYVSLSDQRRMHITLPDVTEQHAIVRMLGALDDRIELNRHMNETLETAAQSLFKSWFVEFDPIYAKVQGRHSQLPPNMAQSFPEGFDNSELGETPKGWEVRTLYNCADYVNGSVFGAGDFSPRGSGLPIIKIAELKEGITSQTKFTLMNMEPKYLVKSGDILFSWSGSPETSIDIFIWTGTDGWLNQHIFKIQLRKPEQKLFVYYLLRFLKPVFIEIARNKQTTGLGHVTTQDLKRLKIAFPVQDALRTFNRLVEPFFDRTYLNRVESDTLAALRDSLLPKLVSGELRLRDAERIVGRIA